MTNMQRLKEIFIALLLFAAAVLLLVFSEEGYLFLLSILSLVFFCAGVKELFYFVTIGRFMVEGKGALYRGIIKVDIGIVTGTLTDVPPIYILIYLLVAYLFSALVELLRALEMKREGARSWKFKAAEGVVCMILAAACLIFSSSQSTVVIIYGIGLLYTAVSRFILAFRRTKFVYFQ